MQPVGAGHGLGWVLGAVDSKGRSCICKAASIKVAGASYLIPGMLVIVISGYHFFELFAVLHTACQFCELLSFHWCSCFVAGKLHREEFSSEGSLLGPAGVGRAH